MLETLQQTGQQICFFTSLLMESICLFVPLCFQLTSQKKFWKRAAQLTAASPSK